MARDRRQSRLEWRVTFKDGREAVTITTPASMCLNPNHAIQNAGFMPSEVANIERGKIVGQV